MYYIILGLKSGIANLWLKTQALWLIGDSNTVTRDMTPLWLTQDTITRPTRRLKSYPVSQMRQKAYEHTANLCITQSLWLMLNSIFILCLTQVKAVQI